MSNNINKKLNNNPNVELENDVNELIDKARSIKTAPLFATIPDQNKTSTENMTSISMMLDDPEGKYDIYYFMRSLLKEYLPEGKKHNKLRKSIYEQKSIFLTGKHKKNDVEKNASNKLFTSNILFTSKHVLRSKRFLTSKNIDVNF